MMTTEKIKAIIGIINHGYKHTREEHFYSEDIWVIPAKYYRELKSLFNTYNVFSEMSEIVSSYPEIFNIYGIGEAWNSITYMNLPVEVQE